MIIANNLNKNAYDKIIKIFMVKLISELLYLYYCVFNVL